MARSTVGWLELVLLTALLSMVVGQDQTVSVGLELGTPLDGSLSPPNYAFYSVELPDSVQNDSVLLVTVDSLNKAFDPGTFVSYVVIIVSQSVQFPTYETADQVCYFHSLDSCSLTNLTANSTVYISVYFYSASNFTVIAELMQAQPIKLGYSYDVNFTTTSAGVVSFTIDEQYDQVMIVLEHLDFYLGESYAMVEACGYIPSDSKYEHPAVSLGAFRKAIKLSGADIHTGMPYYLLIAGENQVELKLTIRGFYSDQRSVPMNSSIFDLVLNDTIYSMGYVFPADGILNGLVIRMRQLSGYGTITVQYCFNFNFTFQDMSGQNGQLLITEAKRQSCLEYMESQGSLLVENIIIEVSPIYGQMGVTLAIYESNSTGVTVQINELEYGLIQANTVQKYRLSVYEREPVNVSLVTHTYDGQPIFLLSKCTIFGCTPLLTNTDSTMQFKYDQNCKGYCHYQLTVSSDVDSSYSFVFKLNGYHIRLFEDNSDMGFVELNQYVFYNITLQNATDAQSVTIRLEQISGTLSFLSSRMFTEPTFEALFQNDSDVNYIWNGTATYTDNLDQPIYVGVLGETEGMFRLSYTVSRQQNTPSAYTLLTEDTLNEFVVTDQPLLLKYAPHSIPYSLSFYPRPFCISYGSQLPLPLECMPLPNLLSEAVFINITGNAVGVVMRISVDEGEFLLGEDRPLFIQCHDSCYEVVVVEVAGTERIIHSGYGRLIDNSTQKEVSNGVLEISCPNGEDACDMYLIAKLDYAGEMTLELESSGIVEVGWWAVPLSLQSLPRKLYYRLPQNRSSVLNIDSRAAVLKIAHKVQLLNDSYSNLMELEFSENFDKVSNPFRRSYMVEVSNRHMEMLGCNNPRAQCVLTVTIELDTDYEYSEDFLKNGMAYVSASSYAFFLQQNLNVRRVAMEQVQYFEYFNNVEKDVTVLLTPLTTCRPTMIYTSNHDEYPTLDNYEKISNRNISVSNASHLVIGVVAEEELCLYDIILLTDTHGMQFLVQGVPQRVSIPAKGTTYLLYNSRSNEPFEIQSTHTTLKIFVNEVPYGANPMNYLPGPGTAQSKYSSQDAPLLITPNSTANYIIALDNEHSLPIESNVMVVQNDETILLLHNTLYRQITAENETDSYEYFSANSFYMYFLSAQGTFSVNVWSYSSDYNRSFTFNNQSREPWVLIEVDGNLSLFYIEVLSKNPGRYTIEVVEFGSEGRPSLEPGLPFFDQFTTAFSLNCYRLQGTPDNSHPVQVSFVYSEQLKQKLHAQNVSSKEANPIFFYDWKPIDQEISTGDQPKLVSAVDFNQGAIYTIENKYGWYTICFESRSNLTLNEEYYVVASSERLQSVVPTIPIYESHATDKFTSRYELVVFGNQTIVADLINCKGDSQLTASTNYNDFLSGRTTDIVEHYSDSNYYSGLMNATRGYLYLGVKSLSVNNSYLLKTTSYPANSQLRLNSWKASDLKLKLLGNGSEMHVVVQPLKCITNNCSNTQQTTYHLYVSTGCMTAMEYSRCGVTQSNVTPNASSTNQTMLTYRMVYDNVSNPNNVTFRIPLKLLPDKFSVACKAETTENDYGVNRTVPYFYGTSMSVSKSDIVGSGDTGMVWSNLEMSWGMIVFIFIAVFVVLLTGLILVCRQRKIGWFKPKPRVSFELQPLNRTQEASQQPEADYNRKELKERDPAPAYGEFVDESRL